MTIHEWSIIIGADLARRGEPVPPAGLPRRALEALQTTLGHLTAREQETAHRVILCAWRRAQKGGAPC
jgi:hypothetical protein